MILRRVVGRAAVLGYSQRASVVDHNEAARLGWAVVRRRTGGGVVLVDQDSLWVDAWIPTTDRLADADVLQAAAWVGRWWVAALVPLGAGALAVHTGRLAPGPWSDRVCFAGVGAGEVTTGRRKVVGVAQWRCRQGSLFQVMAYRRWDPAALVDVLAVPAWSRAVAVTSLRHGAVGLDELLAAGTTMDAVERSLLEQLPSGGPWDIQDETADLVAPAAPDTPPTTQ